MINMDENFNTDNILEKLMKVVRQELDEEPVLANYYELLYAKVLDMESILSDFKEKVVKKMNRHGIKTPGKTQAKLGREIPMQEPKVPRQRNRSGGRSMIEFTGKYDKEDTNGNKIEYILRKAAKPLKTSEIVDEIIDIEELPMEGKTKRKLTTAVASVFSQDKNRTVKRFKKVGEDKYYLINI